MNEQYSRTISLLGEENFNRLQQATVLIVGVGGVGGTALECLARSGIKNFIIIDKDIVDISNLNRQLLFTREDINKSKVECAQNHLLKINDSINVIPLEIFLDENNVNILNQYKIDFIIDAIDSIYSKLALIKYAQENKIKFVISLGMGKRMNPSDLILTSLNKSTGDPLAKKLRYLLKQENIDISHIKCVYSKEEVLVEGQRTPSSMMMVPSACGLLLAKECIDNLIRKEEL
ncbi:MAG: ThiF family adenylyltransferase [Bacilli bacterium]|nr:ThiF family adenylyltransferase [Bacilli bacterium]